MRTNLFILTVLSLMLFSCKSEIDTLISVQLHPTFLTLSEGSNEPMKMKSATTDTVQVYAVQVYENEVPYYYGLFTDVSKMQIALTTSKTYKFKVAAYKAGTGKGLKTLTDSEGVNYYLPTKLAVKNAFIKGDLLKDIDSPTALNLSGQQKDFAEVDAFYASKSVTVEKGTTTIDFSLLRMGFGINFTVDALTSGNMEIFLGNDTIKLNSSKTTATTVRQFNKATNNFTDIHSKAETFGDSIAVSAKWTGTNGTTVTASGKYKFLRNYQKTINIELNTLTNSVTFEGWKIPTNGLVAWYPFNGNANDESGNGNNGTVNGAILTTDRFGNSNTSYLLNNNYIQVQNSLVLNPQQQLSLSSWVYINHYLNDQAIISKSYSSAIEPFIQYCLKMGGSSTSNRVTQFQVNLNGIRYTIETISEIPLNTWVMITGTFNGQSLNLYLNGVAQTQISSYIGLTKQSSKLTLTGLISSYNTAVNFGRWQAGGANQPQYIDGKIDDVGIWNRALKQEEITDLYNAK